jgi:hypothetical protein
VCRIDLKFDDAAGELAVVQLEDNQTARTSAPVGRPPCPTCGESAAVAGPVFVEFSGTLDMIAQYFCNQCCFTFAPVSPQSANASLRQKP